ncbi:MAG TPA: methionine--tRNA ligase [Bacilli bacterium]
MKTCYITTPIYYASGNVHIGNSYSTIVCDCFARYHRLKGDDTFYLTGMDEHGQKVEEAAAKQGKSPQQYVDEIAEATKALWKRLNITNDDFIRTSEDRHQKVVQAIFEQLISQGDIYLGEYEGNYCVPCEAFFTKTQLNEDGTCPDCGRPTKLVREESYFLNLKKYQDRLLQYIYDHPDFIQPESRRNEVIAFIKQGLEDLCVSRTSFKWGIPVLSNPKHVVYVWIDALSNYISTLGYKTDNDEMYQKYWVNGDEVVHVVGKDILRFHAIYWPIMLMALNVPIKFKLYAHGWVLMKEGKMSKSKGNIIYPDEVIERYGVDPLRLYLVSEMPLGNDAIFTYERFIEKYNSFLANDLGNLVCRTLAMINKYFNGKLTKGNQNYFSFDEDLEKVLEEVVRNYQYYFDNFQFQNGINEIWRLISRANKYIDETTPWGLAKESEKQDQLQNVLYHLYEVLRIVAIMISPVMPETSEIIFDELGVKDLNSFASLEYGKTMECIVTDKPAVLFKRLKWEDELKKYE